MCLVTPRPWEQASTGSHRFQEGKEIEKIKKEAPQDTPEGKLKCDKSLLGWKWQYFMPLRPKGKEKAGQRDL